VRQILSKPTQEGRKAEMVFRKAVARVIEKNRRLGLPIAVMWNGKAVLMAPDKAVSAVRESRAVYGKKRK
jgi:hypothetical protein